MTNSARPVPVRDWDGASRYRICLYFQRIKFWSRTCDIQRMILLVWASERAQSLAAAITERQQQEVQIASTLQQGCERLRSDEYSAALIDQWISEAEPARSDLLFDCLGGAVPLFVNFGINSQDRVLRELRAALERRQRETVLVRRNAEVALHDELKDDVTALLLSCGVAMREPGLSESLSARLNRIKEVAIQIRARLAGEEAPASSA